jgi:hypothetical protein
VIPITGRVLVDHGGRVLEPESNQLAEAESCERGEWYE